MARTSLIRKPFRQFTPAKRRKTPRLRVENLEDRAMPAVITWAGAASGDFSDGTKWVGGVAPGAGDDAVINTPTAVVTVAANSTVGSLNITGDLSVNSGTFTVNNGGSFNNDIVVAGGAKFDLQGGSMAWTGGQVSGAGTFEVSPGSTLAISGAAIKTLSQTTVDNLGTIQVAGTGNINTASDAHLNNVGQFDFLSDADVLHSAGLRPTFVNTGLLTKSSGAGLESDIDMIFNNQGGEITVNSGQLTLAAGTSTGGTYNVASMAVLDLTDGETQNYTGTFTGTGAGTVQLASGIISVSLSDADFNFPAGLFQWTGGTFTGLAGSKLTNSGTITLAGSANKDLSIVLLDNPGTINVTGNGTWRTGTTTISNTGTIDFQSDASLLHSFLIQPTLINAGAMKKTGGIGTSAVGAILNNEVSGTVNSQSGSLAITGGGASSGAFSATSGNEVAISSNYTLNAGASGTGVGNLTLTNNTTVTLTAPVSIDNLNWLHGGVQGTGNLTVSGNTSIAGGNNKFISGTMVTNNGVANLTGTGQLQMGNGGLFQNNGTFNYLSDAQVVYNFGTTGNAFNNAGTLNRNTSTGMGGFDNMAFNNTGAVNIATGTFFVDGGINTGSWNISPGAFLDFAQNATTLNTGTSITGSGNVRVSGGSPQFNSPVSIQKLVLAGGSINGAGSIAVNNNFDFSGGTFRGNAILSPGATMALSGGASKLMDGGTITNNGSVTLTGTAELQMANGSVITNNGTFTIISDVDVRYTFGTTGNQFNNFGTFNKTSPSTSGTTAFTDVAFNNFGTANVASGVLSLRTGASSGNFNLGPQATLVFVTFPYTLNPGTDINGDGLVYVTSNSTLVVNATLDANRLLLDSGRITGPGKLTVNDDFNWHGGAVGTNGTPFVLEMAPGSATEIGGTTTKLLESATLRNLGTLTFSGVPELQFANSATLHNLGIFDIQTAASLRYTFGASGNRVVNSGTLIKSAGVGTTLFNNVDLDNTGTVRVASNALQVTGSVTQLNGGSLNAGTWEVDTGASLILPANVTTNNATVILDGVGASFPQINSLANNNGTFRVANGQNFSTTGLLANNGTLTVGPLSTVTVNGAYTQGPTGKYVSEIADQPASNKFGVLNVTGATSLDGTVKVDLVQGFGPTAGGNFQIMNFASQTGAFIFSSPSTPMQGDLFAPVVNPTSIVAQSIVNAADLAVTNVFVPASANPGGNVQIGFEVKNLSSTATVISDWVDSVYLSLDNLLDASDILVERVNHTGILNPNVTYLAQTNASLPGINPSNYKVIVVSDSRSFVPDTNRSNNTAVAPATLAVTVPTIAIGATINGTIANGQDIYYRVDLPAGKTFKVGATFEVASELEMYVSYQQVPTRDSFEKMTFPVGQTNGQIILPGTQAGPFYILLHGREGAIGGKAFNLKVEELSFSITSLENAKGSNLGSSTVTINGAGFTPATTVRLQGGIVDMPATQVYFVDSTKLYATFNLNGVAAGTYGVTALNDAAPATITNAYTVTTGVVGKLVTKVSAPAITRALTETTVTVDYENTGETDIVAPVMTLTADWADMRLPEQKDYVGRSVQFIGINPNGPAGILPAGFKGSITFPAISRSAGAHVGIHYELKIINNPDATIDWNGAKATMRPASIPVDAWDAVFANFVSQVGTTAGSYQQVIANNATYLSQLGESTYDLNRLVFLEYMKANADISAGSVASSVDAALPSPGLPLTFVRTANATIAGRYQIGRLGRGWSDNWDIGATTDASGNATIHHNGIGVFYRRNAAGLFEGNSGNFSTLTQTAGKYELRLTSGMVYSFLANGKLEFVEDANGNRITAGYDSSARLSSLTHSSGASFTLAYNSQNRLASLTDSAGRVSTYHYDAGGDHLSAYTDKFGTTNITYYSGTDISRLHAITEIGYSDDTHVFFTYDQFGRLIDQRRDSISGQSQEGFTFAYGDIGASYILTNAIGSQTQTFFDDKGNPRRTIDANGNATNSTYCDCGLLRSQVLPDGTTATFEYDERGNVTQSTDALGHSTIFTYNADDRLASYTDARGNTTSYMYDSHGNLTRITYADGSSDQYDYDSHGSVSTWTNARGQVLQYAYNDLGLVTSKTYADTSTVTFNYDPSGLRLLSSTDSNGTYSFTYDSRDSIETFADPFGHTLAFTYNSVGQRLSSTDELGFQVNYEYDALGRLSELTDAIAAVIAQYTYDTAGRLVRAEKGNGTFTTYAYDLAGNVTSVTNNKDANTVNSTFDYTYDNMNRVATMTAGGIETSYTYDAVGQLTSVVLPGRSIEYAYDAAGNRSSVTDNNVMTNYIVNSRNQPTSIGSDSYSYDLDGNLSAQTVSGVTTSFTFGQENRLIGMSTPALGESWNFQTDPFGQRVATTHNGVMTRDVIDPTGLGNLVAQYDAGNNLISHYMHGGGLVGRVDPIGDVAYYDFDIQGSTAGITDAAGVYVNRYTYLPFGETTTLVAALDNPFTFIGVYGVRQEANDLSYMRARHYSPGTGQFISNDPLGLPGGDTNVRRYVQNNPVSLVDPSGLQTAGLPAVPQNKLSELCKKTGASGQSQMPPRHPPRPATQPQLPPPGTLVYPTTGPGSYGTPGPYAGYWNGIPYVYSSPNGDPPTASAGADATIKGTGSDSCEPPPPPPPSPPGGPGGSGGSDNRTSNDPNELVGPAGFGPQGFITEGLTLPYTIRFENKSDASLPAQTVTLIQALDDPDLDLDTFQLTAFNFGSHTIHIPSGLETFGTRVDVVAEFGLYVDIMATLDRITKILTVSYRSIDPLTLDVTADPIAGFLPPNDANHVGEGFVSYTVRAQPGLLSGDKIDGKFARIVFDNNDPIDTNATVNTIDIGAPVATVSTLPEISTGLTFPVSWSGTDNLNGSGIATFDVYVSDNAGPWTLWQSQTSATTANYTGLEYHSYDFYAVATDNVGNQEANVPVAEATLVATNGAYAKPDVYGADVGRKLSVSKKRGVLANDPKAAGKSYTAQVVTQPTGGTVTMKPNGSFVFVPNASFTGLDSFTYQTLDSTSQLGNIATVTLATQLVEFRTTKSSAKEAKESVTIRVQLRKPATAVTTVNYTLSGITATAGADFDAAGGTVTFQPGEKRTTIVVPVVNDTTDEDNETFLVAMKNPTNAVVGPKQSTTVTIRDNDAPPKVGFDVMSSNFSEAAGTVTIAVSLSAPSEKEVTVQFAIPKGKAGGSATPGMDYTFAPGTLTFAPGETTKFITINLTDDLADESDETVLFKLSKAKNARITTSKHTLSIADNDP